jgi:hypothetical protein
MITKEFLEKHYKFHDKLVLYTPDDIKLTFSKEPHYHMEGGHATLDLMDLEDFAAFAKARGLSLKPGKTTVGV